MGVTLHYRGKLRSPDLISEITEELQDISSAREWKYTLIEQSSITEDDEHINYPLRGIVIMIKDCEPLHFTFTTEGTLMSIIYNSFPREAIEKTIANNTNFISTKTQFAGIDTHKQIVNLLKYISSKYFDVWECTDDSEYYETGDEKNLTKTMKIIDDAMYALDEALLEHGEELDKSDPEAMAAFISNVLGVDDIEVKIVAASIEEDGIHIIDEDSMLEELLSDENTDDNDDDSIDIDLSELLSDDDD